MLNCVSDAAKVPCIINNSTKIVQCLRRGRDVYMPFKFVKEYFEVSILATFLSLGHEMIANERIPLRMRMATFCVTYYSFGCPYPIICRA